MHCTGMQLPTDYHSIQIVQTTRFKQITSLISVVVVVVLSLRDVARYLMDLVGVVENIFTNP
ncbi:hypothetical protein M378DRAFT_159754 [Amanita muscaria Koide BX008]|uniref:Uncharacterized protein n=1 Tax=Amanita muscaria (strain Koide BX008) TaxID=946122 RepID=A0A0C2XES2_AMAMK|nr:hypothetical protein M378DRAFT_159754 [Amanita muscaria Koide BX008]